ncbi:dihydropteroate synthase [Paracoccus spongiarum]|uniref:Dihydropteroate synthase n=1 Tax=Paracoccus spongiarum TaxID=3064387 RepID=A0ABT9JEN2_9RHOB|nr:dihydropteroate synthase [Paracoccus sp. 2205BS29-5]MDP5308272.1 dihydropteroate synthase [Paracoccus sp. 2205BS29-5]
MSGERRYYRPLPGPGPARWRLAGGWTGFSGFEVLARGRPPEHCDEAPADILAALAAPRAPLAGLTMDRPRIMGIVNATPDSFSDGGQYDPAAQAEALLDAGADLLDIGGESTRPGATEVPVADEIARVLPVLRAVAGHTLLSVDTRKAEVAEAALSAGAGMINDVSGFDFDTDLPGVAARAGVPVCLMHAQGLPADMQDDPRYGDVVLDVYDALEARIARAEAAGIPRRRIIVDPGIGFGKTEAHNLAILRRISLYHGLGCPILLGVSRKRLIGSIGDSPVATGRGPGTLALTLAAVAQGVQIHRVHDVAQIRQGLRLWQAVTNNDEAGT